MLREQSGKRDPRTGSALEVDSAFQTICHEGPANNHLITAYNSDSIKLIYCERAEWWRYSHSYGYAPNSERVDGVRSQRNLEIAFAPMLIEGKVGGTDKLSNLKTWYNHGSFYQF